MPPDLSSPASPPPGPELSVRELLLHSWAGRLFILSAAVKLVLAILRQAVAEGPVMEAFSTAAAIGLVISVGYFLWRLFTQMKRRLLWRVRRKLILSYIFIGVVPALLIIAFFMLGAWVVSMNVSTYLFSDGYEEVVSYASLTATAAASEIARAPASAPETLTRVHRAASGMYGALSIVFVPTTAGVPDGRAGPWSHALEPPDDLPEWIISASEGFAGTIAPPAPDGGDAELVVRAVAAVATSTRRLGYVVVDVPVDREVFDRLYSATGVRAGTVRIGGNRNGLEAAALQDRPPDADRFALFGRGVTILDARDWQTGQVRPANISNTYAIGELYQKLSGAQAAHLQGGTVGQAILYVLVLVAVLFLIIQCVALIMGLALARSITSSIHELFMGTEGVRHGDFTHRIDIKSNDQLGALASSFNQMIGSIENLLQTAAEKKRLEEELRIARQIQMSLLPRGPLEMPGLAVTALCVPAREVGGDYYDFFPLADDRLGLLIADVSGKGTSAALYMAELKGLVLSLSQIYQSPRQLLLEVNRIIAANLDTRSFITMTYALIDMRAGTMTYARAGHTPLIYLRNSAVPGGEVQVLVPNGMVLGLQFPGASEKFAELLEEDRLTLGVGDVIALYTDGISEAMNSNSDLFGDARLGRLIEEHGHLETGELRERILREIESFVGTADQHDDMTMVLLKVESIAAGAVGV